MIAFETWWKQAEARANRAPRTLIALLPLLLAGCGTSPPPPTSQTPPPPPPAPAVPAQDPSALAQERIRSLEASAGLRPLGSPQQVLQSVDLGRRDPFGRLLPSLSPPSGSAMAARGTAAMARRAGRSSLQPLPPPELPGDFSLSGVIQSGGIREAVVTYRDLSGSLRPGDRGGHTTDLLPPGWSVAAIDVQRGVLTLAKEGRKVSVEL